MGGPNIRVVIVSPPRSEETDKALRQFWATARRLAEADLAREQTKSEQTGVTDQAD